MDDLANYRRKIGMFSAGHQPYLNPAKARREADTARLAYSIVFMVLVSLSSILSHADKGVEKNPGPGKHSFHNFTYESESEKIKFLELKKQTVTMVKLSSHVSFLDYCKKNNVIPKGMSTNLTISAAQQDDVLQNKLRSLSFQNSMKNVEIILDHYKQVISSIKLDLLRLQKELFQCCSCDSRHRYLINCISGFKAKHQKRFGKIKQKKISKLPSKFENDTNTPSDVQKPISSDNIWIKTLNLTITEKSFITSGKELCDRLIDVSMSLIWKKFPNFEFQSACLGADLLVYNPYPSIHIHHTGANHFVTTTSLGGPVRLFDSLNLEPTQQLLDQISSIYSPDKSVTPSILQVSVASEQQGPYDCVIFALAFARELASNEDPSTVIFDQSKVREHLLSCLENEEMLQFPKARCILDPIKEIDITKSVKYTNKWSFPKNLSTRVKPKTSNAEIPLKNRFAILSEEQHRRRKGIKLEPDTGRTNIHHKNPFKKRCNKSTIYDLSNRSLSTDDKSVLELGLSFCPSQANFNRETFVNDVFQFVRRLKLREFLITIKTPKIHQKISLKKLLNEMKIDQH